MAEQEFQPLPPPPGMVASLTAGFDAVANHITAILLPVMLDLFIWLGPRVRIDVLVKALIVEWLQLAKDNALPTQNVQQAQTFWELFASQTNLAAILRTFPIGVSSLMAPVFSTETPLGKTVGVEVESLPGLLGWIFLFTIVGWLLGGLFYYQVSNIALKRARPGNRIMDMFRGVFQTYILSISWLALSFLASLPLFLFFTVLTFIGQGVMQFFFIMVTLLVLWLLLPIFFSAHGIFVYGQNAFSSIMQSLRLVRFTMPSLSLFALVMIVISQGLAYLWRIPTPASWLILVGIAAHAFISTALLAASFIHYRDLNAWLQIVLERLRTQTTSARA